jgi:hypothetical protein
MVATGRARYTPHVLVSTVVFEFMHITDEVAGNWAPFEPFNDPLVATIGMGVFTLVALTGLWGVVADRQEGYALAAGFGLFFLIVECWHYFDPANMTVPRWIVLWFAQGSGGIVCILGVTCLRGEET